MDKVVVRRDTHTIYSRFAALALTALMLALLVQGMADAQLPTPSSTATPSSSSSTTPAPSSTATPLGQNPTAQFYVSKSTGNDSNSGTSASSPWQSIAKVVSQESSFIPGTTVYFLGGDVWNETLTLNNVHGSSGSPITFTSYGTGSPIIDGNGGKLGSCVSADQAAGSGSNVSYITVDGFECRNTSQFGINFRVENVAMPGIVIQNNYIHNTGAGAYAGGSGAFDDGNYRNQLNAEDDTAGASGGDGFQIIGNTVNNCGGHNCLQVHYDVGGPLVQGNTVGPGCVHNCIDTKGVVNGKVIANIVTCPNCSSTSAAYYSENTYTANETISYVSNVAYNVPIGFQIESGGTCQTSPCSITAKLYNNTIYNAGLYNLMDSSCNNHTLDIQKNLIDGAVTNIHSGCAMTWNYNDDGGALTISGNPSGPNDVHVNPIYLSPNTGDFTPTDPTNTVQTLGAPNSVTPYAYLGATP
jgi:hypothetical protein